MKVLDWIEFRNYLLKRYIPYNEDLNRVYTDVRQYKKLRRMKIYLTIIFLCISTFIFGQNDLPLKPEKVKKITAKLCDDIMRGRSNALDIPEWEFTMRKMAGYTGTSINFPKYFNNFLNRYNQNLICPCFDGGAEKYPVHHIYKRLLAADLEETYNEYFFEFEDGDVDFNAFEIVNGKRETIVDWAERWIALGRGNLDDIRDIVSVLKDEFGAKRASELPD